MLRYSIASQHLDKMRLLAEHRELLAEHSFRELQIVDDDGNYAMPSSLHAIIKVASAPDNIEILIRSLRGYLSATKFNHVAKFRDENGKTLLDLIRERGGDFCKKLEPLITGQRLTETQEDHAQNTHNAALHCSVDISVIRLFKRYLERKPGAVFDYVEESVRKIDFVGRNAEYEALIENDFQNFNARLEAWDALSNDDLRLLLDPSDRTDAKVAELRYNLKAALRFMKNAIETGSASEAGAKFQVPVLYVLPCGLTVKDVVAFIEDGFKDDASLLLPAEDPEKLQTKNNYFIQVLQYFKEIRREYNAADDDSPDNNKCLDGTINHLVASMNGVHRDVTIVHAESEMFVEEFKDAVSQVLLQLYANPDTKATAEELCNKILQGDLNSSDYERCLMHKVEERLHARWGGALYAEDSYLSKAVIRDGLKGMQLPQQIAAEVTDKFFDGLNDLESVYVYMCSGASAYMFVDGGYQSVISMIKDRKPDVYQALLESLQEDHLSNLFAFATGYLIFNNELETVLIARVDEATAVELWAVLEDKGAKLPWPLLKIIIDNKPEIREKVIDSIIKYNPDCLPYLSEIEDIDIELRKMMLFTALNNNLADVVGKLARDPAVLECEDDMNHTPLMLAINSNNREMIDILISSGVNVDGVNSWGISGLLYAASINARDMVMHLLSHGADINSRDHEGKSAAFYAIDGKCADALKLMIDNGLEINSKNNNNVYPLMFAIQKNDLDSAKILLEAGAETELVYAEGKTLLGFAVTNNNKELVSLLLRYMANPNVLDANGQSMVLYAVAKGFDEVAMLLLENGADPNIGEVSGQRALTFAISANKLALTKKLLEKGAYVNSVDHLGVSALMFAAIRGNHEVVAILIDAGADVNLREVNGCSALSYAINNNKLISIKMLLAAPDLQATREEIIAAASLLVSAKDVEALSLLIDKLDDKRIIGEHLDRALISAMNSRSWDLAKLLLENEADANVRVYKGQTALMYAINEGRLDIVRTIFSKGGDIELVDEYGCTALFYAYANKNSEVMDALLEAGVITNAIDMNGNSTLLYAIADNEVSMVTKLLDNGADIHIVNKMGETPIMIALSSGHVDLALKLMEWGADTNLPSKFLKKQMKKSIENGSKKAALMLLALGDDISILSSAAEGESELKKYLDTMIFHTYEALEAKRELLNEYLDDICFMRQVRHNHSDELKAYEKGVVSFVIDHPELHTEDVFSKIRPLFEGDHKCHLVATSIEERRRIQDKILASSFLSELIKVEESRDGVNLSFKADLTPEVADSHPKKGGGRLDDSPAAGGGGRRH